MNKDLVSIIIPIYNTEHYIGDTVDSCIRQTYKNIEIILVDDGSTDNSARICDNIASLYENVIVFHKKNGGLSDARNYGVQHCNGKFVTFLDSDDLIDSKFIHRLLQLKKTDNYDIAIAKLFRFKELEKIKYTYGNTHNIYESKSAMLEFLYQRNITPTACAAIYDRQILLDNPFKKGQRFEDNDFLFRVLCKINSIIVDNSYLYAYRCRVNSITTGKFSEQDFDIVDIGKDILNKTAVMDNDIQRAACVYQCTNCIRLITTAEIDYMDDERYKYCETYLRENAWNVLKDRNARISLKIGVLLFILRIPSEILKLMRNCSRVKFN